MAEELGRNDYNRLVGRMSEQQYRASGYSAGIQRGYNPETGLEHVVYVENGRVYDSLDPGRRSAGGYRVMFLEPIQRTRLR